MTRIGNAVKFMGITMAVAILLGACAKEKIENVLDLREDYTLTTIGSAGVSGTIAFKMETNGTRVAINLVGADPNNTYTAAIFQRAVIESGPMVIALGNIPGNTGKLDTLIQKLDNGVAISFTELVNFDGNISIRETGEAGKNVALADIGSNVFTGKSRTYALDTIKSSGIKGTLTLQERKNSHTLATLALSGINTTTGIVNTYPAGIYTGKAADTISTIAITLGNADPATGKVVKNITVKDDSTAIKFSDLVTFDGHVSVQEKNTLGSIVVAQGNIGQHAP